MKSVLLPNTLTIEPEPHQAPPDDPVVTGSTQTFVTLFLPLSSSFCNSFILNERLLLLQDRGTVFLSPAELTDCFHLIHKQLFPSCCFIPADGQVLPQREKEFSLIRIQPESCCPKRTSRPPPEIPTNPLPGVRAYRPGTSNYVPESSASTATSPEADFRPSNVSSPPSKSWSANPGAKCSTSSLLTPHRSWTSPPRTTSKRQLSGQRIV